MDVFVVVFLLVLGFLAARKLLNGCCSCCYPHSLPAIVILHPSTPFYADGEGSSSVATIAALQGEVSELKLELVRLEQSKADDDGVIEGLKTQLTEMTLEKEGKAEPTPPPTESDRVG